MGSIPAPVTTPAPAAALRRGIPGVIKGLALLWLVLWVPLHLRAYPVSSFLWFCAYGNVLVVIGLWRESAFLLSWQAVALLIPQMVYGVDALTARRGTAYLFDEGLPPEVRALSLFHFVMPPLLVWAVTRTGYDRRALAAQTIASSIVLTVSFFGFREQNIGVPWSAAHPVAHWICALVAWPLLFSVPAHLLLSRGWIRLRA